MKQLNSIEKMEEMISDSFKTPQVVFKHSTRCPVSAMALSRMVPFNDQPFVHLVDVIGHRDVSSQLANTFSVMHQSPQLLIVNEGNCIYHTSHMGIWADEVKHQLAMLGQ